MTRRRTTKPRSKKLTQPFAPASAKTRSKKKRIKLQMTSLPRKLKAMLLMLLKERLKTKKSPPAPRNKPQKTSHKLRPSQSRRRKMTKTLKTGKMPLMKSLRRL